MGRRRLANVAVFLLIAVIANALGYVPWEVPVIMVAWLGGLWVATGVVQRAPASRAVDVETLSYCFNAVLLTLACFHMGGVTWLAGTFYALVVLIASAALPRSRAIFVAAICWLGFALLAIGPAAGFLTVPEFGFADPRAANMSFAIVTVVVQAVALTFVMLMQQFLVGALRETALANRALLDASTDIIVSLDRRGVIQEANPAFAGVAAAGSALNGASIEDVVPDTHRGYLQLKLAHAFKGTRVPLEVPYEREGGESGWLAGTLVPFQSPGIEPRVLMVARDVTLEHEIADDSLTARAHVVAAARAGTAGRAMGDVLDLVRESLATIEETATALRGRLNMAEDAQLADHIAQEAERLRATTEDVLEGILVRPPSSRQKHRAVWAPDIAHAPAQKPSTSS